MTQGQIYAFLDGRVNWLKAKREKSKEIWGVKRTLPLNNEGGTPFEERTKSTDVDYKF